MESQAQLSKQHPHIPRPRRQAFETYSALSGVVSGHQPTFLPIMVSTTTETAPGAKARSTALEAKEKNDRDRSTLNTGNSLRVHSLQATDSRQNLDANQSN